VETRAQFPRGQFGRFALEAAICAVGFATVTLALVGLYRDAGPLAKLALAGLAAAGLIAVYVGTVRSVEDRPVEELAWHRLPRGLLGVGLGTALVAGTLSIIALLGGYRVTGTGPLIGLVARVGPSLHSAVWEELAFRGVLFRWLGLWLGSARAVAVSAAVFGAMHGLVDNGSLWSAVAVAVEAGVLLSTAYWATGNLWLPIGMHFGWNFTLGGVFGGAVSGTPVPGVLVADVSGPTWLTGGAFGIEASIPAVVVCVAASLGFWRLARAKA
jgi:membrane protease YdiL (CAAX protease family)